MANVLSEENRHQGIVANGNTLKKVTFQLSTDIKIYPSAVDEFKNKTSFCKRFTKRKKVSITIICSIGVISLLAIVFVLEPSSYTGDESKLWQTSENNSLIDIYNSTMVMPSPIIERYVCFL